MPDFGDVMAAHGRASIGGRWADLWDRYGGTLLHVEASLPQVAGSGAAAGVLFLETGCGWSQSDQAAFVSGLMVEGVGALSVDLYLSALSGVGPVDALALWRDGCDRMFSGLVIGPDADAMVSDAVLRHALHCLASNRPVFILRRDWKNAAAGASGAVVAA